jgi:hypothetical protein
MRSKKLAPLSPPEICPVCGEDVPRKALACLECGADHRSGWRADADEADLPVGDFDYDAFMRDEFGRSAKPRGTKLLWWLTAMILILALLASYFLG